MRHGLKKRRDLKMARAEGPMEWFASWETPFALVEFCPRSYPPKVAPWVSSDVPVASFGKPPERHVAAALARRRRCASHLFPRRSS